ncbi:MAG: excinuclease ABC subunit UvrC [Candidatus Lokiarchaeota archaeon]|nr:excinuclease ABC subunit UvrC [Candidatus Lokiarchaeota archaeon]MBD3201787.1 excinuclease ABC subunit UvrC [Candidatus Lokiarchaeota archaeon]
MTDLELQRKSFPNESGVYLFKDIDENVIYIGKAINLRKRVNQYFLKTKYSDPYYEEKINELVKRIDKIEYLVTENEKEALILENILIKKHTPRFNVFMRDAKSYPWVMITYSEKYPRIRIMRNPRHYSQKNLFLGPYTDKKEIQRILRDLRKIFPYCSCKRKVKKSSRPCLYFQIKLCPGPCIEAINPEEYLDNIKQIEMFLKGETNDLKDEIKSKMEHAALKQNYEKAAYWRDKLEAIESSTTEQYVLLNDELDKDIIGYFTEKDYASMVIIHIREGKITNKSSFTLDLREKIIKKDQILSSLLEQYYQNNLHSLPDIIIIPKLYQALNPLKLILKDNKNHVAIRKPLESNEFGLMRIASKNAKVRVNQKLQMEKLEEKEKDKLKETLQEIQKLLNLPEIPRIIEGFDISNIQGRDATGSMVYFLEGKPYNRNYRHYKIRSKTTPDDVGMMKEVIERRYYSILKRDGILPDLILVDGGKGQLNAALSVLDELGINIPAIGLAKKFEEIYVPGKKETILLPDDSPILNLFKKIRDEAHRFAVRLHKKQRKKRITHSKLEDIKGIGPATRNKLLKRFGSLAGVKKASFDELSNIVSDKLAYKIKEKLK